MRSVTASFGMVTPVIRKHSATLHGHRTSFSLEDEFWEELKRIAADRDVSIAGLIATIDDGRPPESNLSSALRVYVLRWLRDMRATISQE